MEDVLILTDLEGRSTPYVNVWDIYVDPDRNEISFKRKVKGGVFNGGPQERTSYTTVRLETLSSWEIRKSED